MKSFLLIVATLVANSAASTRVLEWDANPAEEQVSGYRLEMQTGPDGPWEWVLSVQAGTSCETPDLAPGVYSFRVLAYRLQTQEAGEPFTEFSPPSNVVTVFVPSPPQRLRVAVQASDDMSAWEQVAVIDLPAGERRQYYRLVFEP